MTEFVGNWFPLHGATVVLMFSWNIKRCSGFFFSSSDKKKLFLKPNCILITLVSCFLVFHVVTRAL